jgi:AraC-like DNA-binding protein
MTDTTHIILYSANLIFIVTHLYGWLLKWFYRPEAYREHFHELFPAQRSVGIIYLLQLFELPYLLQIGDSDALLYVNAFSLLFFSIQMLIMCEGYFFPENKHRLNGYWLFIPAVVVLLPMFLQAINLISMPEGWRIWTVGAVSLLFMAYFSLSVRMALRIRNAVRRANEDQYADSDDFPVRLANLIRWIPTLVLILLAINFYADDVWVKFGRDILFTVANVWFCILTLNPWRKVASTENSDFTEYLNDSENTENNESQTNAEKLENTDIVHHASDSRFDDLGRRLELLLTEEKIFTEPHITSDVLISRLGTNSKYLAEVIRRCGYQSFYDMISLHRVRHAISLIHQHPDKRLADIAEQCGFSSQASMAKAFKAQGKDTPSSYRIA